MTVDAPKLAGRADRHVVDHAAIHEHLAAATHRRKKPGNGDRRPQRDVQRALVDHHGLAGSQVGRDGSESAGELLDERVITEGAMDGLCQRAGVEQSQSRGQ